MSEIERNRFHSVILDESRCKGCTLCVTTCPTEAIRVRGGLARITEMRCIDCGKCIIRCPNNAKKALVDSLKDLEPGGKFSHFTIKVALPAPSLYGQFSQNYSLSDIHRALLSAGFDAVFPVAFATTPIVKATRELLDKRRHPEIPRPLLSSSCPAIIKFIQIRYPTLIEHIIPLIAPMELAGRLAKEEILQNSNTKNPPSVGCFFISPCSAKITEALVPQGNETSSIDGVFSINDLFMPLLQALQKNAQDDALGQSEQEPSDLEIGWGHAEGEAKATTNETDFTSLSVDGMDRCIQVLEEIENGKLKNLDFLELMACVDGCVGGPLAAINPSIAQFNINLRENKIRTSQKKVQEPSLKTENSMFRLLGTKSAAIDCAQCLKTSDYVARPTLLLDPDFSKAMHMMDEMERINEALPGIDCGACGAPNCHALAEDIVRGNARISDCIVILKEQYRELLEKK